MNGLTPVLVLREYGLGAEQFAATEAAIAIGAVIAGSRTRPPQPRPARAG